MKGICSKLAVLLLAALFLFPAAASALRGPGDRTGTMLYDAVVKYNDEDYAGAHRLLQQLLKEEPGNDAAHYYMGLVRFALSNAEGAESSLKKAVALDSGNFWYRFRLAGLYSVTGRPELTLSMYEQLLKDFPKKTELYYSIIELYVQQKEYEAALGVLDQIETVFGENEMTAMMRFDLLRSCGREEEGFEKLREFNSQHSLPNVSVMLGDYYMGSYRDTLAEQMYREALEFEKDYAPAYLGLAGICHMNGDFSGYFGYLNRFMSNPSVNPAYKSKYLENMIMGADGRFIKAFLPQMDSLVEAAVLSSAGDTAVNSVAGLYYYGTARPLRAEECFLENVRLAPGSAQARANYMDVLYFTGKWDSLRVFSRESSELFPEEPYFVELNAVASMMDGDPKAAIKGYEALLKMAQGDSAMTVRACSVLGDLYHSEGNAAMGNRYYDRALKLSPDNVIVLNNYAYFLSISGKGLRKAYAMSKKCVEAEPDNPTYLDTFGWILYLMDRPLEAKSFFKHAMLYGGRESAVILDHYAEVLFKLGDYDLAMLYWGQAKAKNAQASSEDQKIEGLEEKIERRKAEIRDR